MTKKSIYFDAMAAPGGDGSNERPFRSFEQIDRHTTHDCPSPKHERRVVGHVSGWQEQMDTCVCGKPWPCPPEKASARPTEAQCSWGCHYVGDQFIRYAACTVHGASGKATEVRCGVCGETKTHGPKCGYAGSPVGQ